MVEQRVLVETLENGLTVVIEPMRDVQSASFTLLIPAGSVFDSENANGTAAVLCDHVTRGAGAWDTRALSLHLDNLGVQRSEGVGPYHLSLGGAMLAENLADVLDVYADIVLRPRLPEAEFESSLMGVEQSLLALEDEPRQKVMQELRRRTYPNPWGRPADGELEHLENITPASVEAHYRRCFRPNGSVLGVAGAVDPQRLMDRVRRSFSPWAPIDPPELAESPVSVPMDHMQHDSTQTQIGIAYRSVPYHSSEYYAAWAAVSVLSGGMSSRLWTEVREKRGLCYSVYATLHSLRDEARVLCYAGSLTERAQETLDVMLHELQSLKDGITDAELERCKARAKSSLIMQQESTISRASSIARDWYHLGEIRTLEEIHRRIDALSVDSVMDHVHRHPAAEFNILTIGARPLEVTGAVSSASVE